VPSGRTGSNFDRRDLRKDEVIRLKFREEGTNCEKKEQHLDRKNKGRECHFFMRRKTHMNRGGETPSKSGAVTLAFFFGNWNS